MQYQLLTLPNSIIGESTYFLEGLVLAANMATKPLMPETWLKIVFTDQAQQISKPIEDHITQQYTYLKANEYSLLDLFDQDAKLEQLADVAEGFMTLWPTIEKQWQEVQICDGTLRMLQALLTSFMLAIDEEQTQNQMREAGIELPPTLDDFIDRLDIMITEVAQAADEAMTGAKSQAVNPYKEVRRNDPCLCGSGKKFKQCCGK